MLYPTVDQVVEIHQNVLWQDGGTEGIRDQGALQSALEGPREGVFDREFYPSLSQKAAVLWFRLARAHAFNDGNKRTAIIVMLTFVEVNGKPLIGLDPDRLYDMAVGIVTGEVGFEDVVDWLRLRL